MSCDPTVDLIYAGSVSVLQQALRAKYKFKKPLVCWVWDIPYNWREWGMNSEGLKANAKRDRANTDRVNMLKECDMIISSSKWTQKVLKEQYGLASEQIYFYIDVKLLDSIPRQTKEKQVIQISRFFYNKRFEDSIIAMKNIKDYRLKLIGTGISSHYGNMLKHYAFTEKPVVNNIIFQDSIPRKSVLTELKKSEVLVSPSVFEGWGITPIEALHCNIPVLLSDLPVYKEVYGDNLLYHKRTDPEDMAEKLKKLLTDKYLQKKIVNACKPIIAEFTPEVFAKKWKDIIKQC